MPTIRERAVQWLIDNPGEFTVNRLAVEVGLERRQGLNALHGLRRSGLASQLQHQGSGVWSYAPSKIVQPQPDDFGPTGPTTRVPIGWKGHIRVIARAGDDYVVQVLDEDDKPNGLHLKVSPIAGGYELMDPIPT